MAGGHLLTWTIFGGLASVLLLCEFIAASSTASEENMLFLRRISRLGARSDLIRERQDETSTPVSQKSSHAADHWTTTASKSHKHHVEERSHRKSAKDRKIRKGKPLRASKEPALVYCVSSSFIKIYRVSGVGRCAC